MVYRKIKLKDLVSFIFTFFGEKISNFTLIILEEESDTEICVDIFLGRFPEMLSNVGERYVYDFSVNCCEYELTVELMPEE